MEKAQYKCTTLLFTFRCERRQTRQEADHSVLDVALSTSGGDEAGGGRK